MYVLSAVFCSVSGQKVVSGECRVGRKNGSQTSGSVANRKNAFDVGEKAGIGVLKKQIRSMPVTKYP
jgi:hypothetical protein